MNVLNEIAKENGQPFEYPDEKIASDIYHVSLSYACRALNGMNDNERKQKEKLNKWLECETEHIHDVPVLAFDNITRKLSNGKSSCDAFFYNFDPCAGEQHYLAELKNTNKKTVLSMIKDEGKDGIYNKVNDSVEMIKNQLEFGGKHEKDDIIVHTHFFIIYAGKNDVPSREPIEMVKKTAVERDSQGKQRKAGRMIPKSVKSDEEIYGHFENKIRKLGLAACDEDTFPGDALPRARKIIKGRTKQRVFSLFSARDFAAIVDSVFFSAWKWGSYQSYFHEGVGEVMNQIR
ncbi:MAG: hypothetical protein HDR16_07905 [Lachnospiraceae bacterium]|nr:hypothetical protein [Lachnospiraceae bacterium]